MRNEKHLVNTVEYNGKRNRMRNEKNELHVGVSKNEGK